MMIITRFRTQIFLILLLIASLLLAACQARPENISPAGEERLKVVATTTFVGDIVGSIAGDKIDLKILLVPGQNPHSFLISPRDMVSLTEADLLFVNGFGLEEFLDELLEGSDFPGSQVIVWKTRIYISRISKILTSGSGRNWIKYLRRTGSWSAITVHWVILRMNMASDESVQ